jgi:RNA polymerase sigma-70 factor (ECF subfamily)
MPKALLADLSDAELLVASRQDALAFAELYDRWAEPLLGFFYRRLKDPEVAADLMAETVATMFEKRDRFRDIGHPASAWIFTIAARQLSRYRRRETIEMNAVARLGWTVPVVDQESAEAIEAIESHGRGRDLEQVLNAMPAAERDAVQLKVIEELGYREIAERLSCSVVAARVRVHRGLARLNKSMESTS